MRNSVAEFTARDKEKADTQILAYHRDFRLFKFGTRVLIPKKSFLKWLGKFRIALRGI
jgi:hypothetical protein